MKNTLGDLDLKPMIETIEVICGVITSMYCYLKGRK